jgi:hypothetical protein
VLALKIAMIILAMAKITWVISSHLVAMGRVPIFYYFIKKMGN